jgi:hypothetical protein
LVFEVSDTGIGMSEGEVAKVFAPFEQADNSTTRKFGGTGLGLTITHRIVELMGGTLHAHSRPGVGSTFEVRLPCVPVDTVVRDSDSVGPPLPEGRGGQAGRAAGLGGGGQRGESDGAGGIPHGRRGRGEPDQ